MKTTAWEQGYKRWVITSGRVGPKSENTPRPDSQKKGNLRRQTVHPIKPGQRMATPFPGNKKFRQHSERSRQAERLRDEAQSGSKNKKAVREDEKLNKSRLRTEKTGAKLDNAHEKLANQKPPKKTGPVKAVAKPLNSGRGSTPTVKFIR